MRYSIFNYASNTTKLHFLFLPNAQLIPLYRQGSVLTTPVRTGRNENLTGRLRPSLSTVCVCVGLHLSVRNISNRLDINI